MATNLEKKVIKANTAYYAGNPIMTDMEWDELIDELKRTQPESELLKKGSLAIDKISGERKEKLPIPMFSLEKVKSLEELNEWASQFEKGTRFCVSLKYDGISLLVSNTKVWTRGNGYEGQSSMDRFVYVNDKSEFWGHKYLWGEAIMPKSKFEKYLESGEYKTARNLVAGQFNADNFIPEIVKDIDFVCYGSDAYTLKSEFLSLQKLPHLTYGKWENESPFQSTDIQIFNTFFECGLKEYVVDGLVIEVDDKEKCEKLGRLPNGNPRYAVALKLPEWFEKQVTEVKSVEWNVSKDGKIKPVAIINPVELGGVTINRATCYNASFVVDNKIAPRSRVELIRSGDVIPKILRTIESNEAELHSMLDDITECPECGEPTAWDSGMVEIKCVNPNCKGVRLRKMVYFLETIGVEEFGEPTLKRLYEYGIDSIEKLFNAKLEDFKSVNGLGGAKYKDLQKQKSKLYSKEIPVSKLMTALNCFKGVIGEATSQLIIDELGFGKHTMEKMLEIKGVGVESAKAYYSGFEEFIGLIEGEFKEIYENLKLVYERPKIAQTGKSVCFSGVRDKELQDKLASMGHKIASGVSKNLTVLVVADVNGSTSKISKAKEYGVHVVCIDDREKIMEILNE